MISISIIVPTLDSHQLLPGLVRSLQEQTLNCWSVLFVDGNSNGIHKDWLEHQRISDIRFDWVNQHEPHIGIYGAMNQGLQILDDSNNWILFWGSDDMAASPKVFENLANTISNDIEMGNEADLYVCSARYVNHLGKNMGSPGNSTKNRMSSFKWRNSFRRSLFLGSTPPHQATVFGPRTRKRLGLYSTDFTLASDLDGFLRISEYPDIKVKVLKIELVLMGNAGVSALQGKRRVKEVSTAYRKAFGILWIIPFVLRYLQRILSLFS